MHRRGFLTGVAIGLTSNLVGRSRASVSTSQSTDTAPSNTSLPQSVGLDPLATGLQVPVDVAFAPDSDRHYIVQQDGLAYVLEPGGLRDTPFLDLTDTIESGPENGLLGIALHPNFAENRRVYVRYSAAPQARTPTDFTHTFVLSEFTVTEDGTQINRDSERRLLEIPEPGAHHNAGDLEFGPDGYLYVGVGDGGGGVGDSGRGAVDDWYDAVAGGNGQDVTQNLLGSILRIDVDDRADDKPYGIPSENPLVGQPGLDEHYAWGLRNPWRMSFDGDELFVGDPGRSSYEEVNLVENGGNYGWNVKEGTHCHETSMCPDMTPDTIRGGEPLLDPIIEYPHTSVDADAPVSGNSVIGGCVYRGEELPAMNGVYLFGDLDADGELFAATRPASDRLWPTQPIEVVSENEGALAHIFSFSRDATGEIYILGGRFDAGGLYRIIPGE